MRAGVGRNKGIDIIMYQIFASQTEQNYDSIRTSCTSWQTSYQTSFSTFSLALFLFIHQYKQACSMTMANLPPSSPFCHPSTSSIRLNRFLLSSNKALHFSEQTCISFSISPSVHCLQIHSSLFNPLPTHFTSQVCCSLSDLSASFTSSYFQHYRRLPYKVAGRVVGGDAVTWDSHSVLYWSNFIAKPCKLARTPYFLLASFQVHALGIWQKFWTCAQMTCIWVDTTS